MSDGDATPVEVLNEPIMCVPVNEGKVTVCRACYDPAGSIKVYVVEQGVITACCESGELNKDKSDYGSSDMTWVQFHRAAKHKNLLSMKFLDKNKTTNQISICSILLVTGYQLL